MFFCIFFCWHFSRPGETLIFPGTWWHQTYHLSPTVALAGQILNHRNLHRVMRHIITYCNLQVESEELWDKEPKEVILGYLSFFGGVIFRFSPSKNHGSGKWRVYLESTCTCNYYWRYTHFWLGMLMVGKVWRFILVLELDGRARGPRFWELCCFRICPLFFKGQITGDSTIYLKTNGCFFEILLWILWGSVYVPYCWWFRNPASAEVGSLSHYLQGFSTIPGGCLGFLPSTVVGF